MKTFLAVSVAFCMAVAALSSQQAQRATPRTEDAAGVLRAVDRALGASSLKSLRYSGTGFAYAFLQNPGPDVRYPKFYAKYSRAIDFEKGVSREGPTRAQV